MTDVPLAFVLLDSFVSPNMVAVVEELRARHPEIPVEIVGEKNAAGEVVNAANSPLIIFGEEQIVVMSMPAAVPGDPGLWARAAYKWPEAKSVAARHKAHLVVSALSKGDRQLAVSRAITAVIGALIDVIPECSAVAWRSKVAVSAQIWQKMSLRAYSRFPDYPFSLWVDVIPFGSGSTIGAVTMGLDAYAGREIEFEAGKLDLPTVIDKVTGLTAYLVEHGAVIKDGDTFGANKRERFKVRYENSPRFGGLPTYFCTTALAS